MAAPPAPRALVLLDILSHQGTPAKSLFTLVSSTLASGIVAPERLFIFADLSALACAAAPPPLSPPAAPAHSPLTRRIVETLHGPAQYKRRDKGLPLLPHLLREEGAWEPVSSMSPLLDFAMGASHAHQCDVGSAASLANLHAKLAAFVTQCVAPRVRGFRVTVVLSSHGGFMEATNAPAPHDTSSPPHGHRIGDYVIEGVRSGSEERQGMIPSLRLGWVAKHLVLPIAQAASSAPGGSLLWVQSTCFGAVINRALMEEVRAHLAAERASAGGATMGDQRLADGDTMREKVPSCGDVMAVSTTASAAAVLPLRLALLADRPVYSPLQDAMSCLAAYELPTLFAKETGPLCVLKTSAEAAADAAMATRSSSDVTVAVADAAPTLPPSLPDALCAFVRGLCDVLVGFENLRVTAAITRERARSLLTNTTWAEGTFLPSTAAHPAAPPSLRVPFQRMSEYKLPPREKAAIDSAGALFALEYATAANAGCDALRQSLLLSCGGEEMRAPISGGVRLALRLGLEAAAHSLRNQARGRAHEVLVRGPPEAKSTLATATAAWHVSALQYGTHPPHSSGSHATPAAHSMTAAAHTMTLGLSCGMKAVWSAVMAHADGRGDESGSSNSGSSSSGSSDSGGYESPPWSLTPSQARLYLSVLPSLLSCVPHATVIAARDGSYQSLEHRLAAARLIAASAPASILTATAAMAVEEVEMRRASPSPTANPPAAWAPLDVGDDGITPGTLPRPYAAAIAAAAAEGALATAPGALLMLSDFIAHAEDVSVMPCSNDGGGVHEGDVSPPPSSKKTTFAATAAAFASAWREAAGIANTLHVIISQKLHVGDMCQGFSTRALLQAAASGESSGEHASPLTLQRLEALINRHHVHTMMELAPRDQHRQHHNHEDGGELEMPREGYVPLVSRTHMARMLEGAREGLVYVLEGGVAPGDVLV